MNNFKLYSNVVQLVSLLGFIASFCLIKIGIFDLRHALGSETTEIKKILYDSVDVFGWASVVMLFSIMISVVNMMWGGKK